MVDHVARVKDSLDELEKKASSLRHRRDVDAQNITVGNLAGEQQFLAEAIHRAGINHQFRPNQLQSDLEARVALDNYIGGLHIICGQVAAR